MIFAHPPMVVDMGDGTTASSVCTVFENENRLISISLDDSCGRRSVLSRSDLRLFVQASPDSASDDVTHLVFPDDDSSHGSVIATKENFQKAWDWLNEAGE